MISPVIHYCWFGRGEKPKLAKKCLESWKRFCPGYEIVEWNEDNFDVNSTPYTKYCYENKKWAYLSDYARLAIVFQNGGIYFDTDVELVASIDSLRDCEAFFAFEDPQTVATGLGFGAEKDSPYVKAMIEPYDFQPGEEIILRSCPDLNTAALLPYGIKQDGSFQNIHGLVILPIEYMNPYDDPTGRLTMTEHTVSIHWYSKSALSKKSILRSKLTRPFHRLFGVNCFDWLKR